MRNVNIVKCNFCWGVFLVVIVSFEIVWWGIQVICIQILDIVIIESDRQCIMFIEQFECEDLVYGYMVDRLMYLIIFCSCLCDFDFNIVVGFVVEFSDGFVWLQVMKDLVDGDVVVVGDFYGQFYFELVDVVFGILVIWVGFLKFSVIVFVVRCSYIVICVWRVRNLRCSEFVSSGCKNWRMMLVFVG